MSDEEAMFEVFFQLDRQKRFMALYPNETMPAEWSMGRRGDMLAGWLARASLHVTSASPPSAPGEDR